MFGFFTKNNKREREFELEKKILELTYEKKQLEQEISYLKGILSNNTNNNNNNYNKNLYDEVVPTCDDSSKEYREKHNDKYDNSSSYMHDINLDRIEDRLNRYSEMLGI